MKRISLAAIVTGALIVVFSRAVPPSKGPARSGADTNAEAAICGVGYVEPVGDLHRLAFKRSGNIQDVYVKAGDHVTTGQLLMSLDTSDPKASLLLAERELDVSKAEERRATRGSDEYEIVVAESAITLYQGQLQYAEKEHDRLRSLGHGAASESSLESSEMKVATARAKLRGAQAALSHIRFSVRDEDRALASARASLAEARVRQERYRLADSVLRAPGDGSVLEILKTVGEAATNAEPTVIFGDPTRLQVRAEIDERYVSRLTVDMRVKVKGRGLGSRSYSGTIASIRQIMGRRTVFAKTATERKDLDVVQVLVPMEEGFLAPIGLEVDVEIQHLRASQPVHP